MKFRRVSSLSGVQIGGTNVRAWDCYLPGQFNDGHVHPRVCVDTESPGGPDLAANPYQFKSYIFHHRTRQGRRVALRLARELAERKIATIKVADLLHLVRVFLGEPHEVNLESNPIVKVTGYVTPQPQEACHA